MAKKIENLKEVKDGELKKKLSALREEERAIHFKSEGARSKNVKELKNLKKNIARILTELNQRHDQDK